MPLQCVIFRTRWVFFFFTLGVPCLFVFWSCQMPVGAPLENALTASRFALDVLKVPFHLMLGVLLLVVDVKLPFYLMIKMTLSHYMHFPIGIFKPRTLPDNYDLFTIFIYLCKIQIPQISLAKLSKTLSKNNQSAMISRAPKWVRLKNKFASRQLNF